MPILRFVCMYIPVDIFEVHGVELAEKSLKSCMI